MLSRQVWIKCTDQRGSWPLFLKSSNKQNQGAQDMFAKHTLQAKLWEETWSNVGHTKHLKLGLPKKKGSLYEKYTNRILIKLYFGSSYFSWDIKKLTFDHLAANVPLILDWNWFFCRNRWCKGSRYLDLLERADTSAAWGPWLMATPFPTSYPQGV